MQVIANMVSPGQYCVFPSIPISRENGTEFVPLLNSGSHCADIRAQRAFVRDIAINACSVIAQRTYIRQPVKNALLSFTWPYLLIILFSPTNQASFLLRSTRFLRVILRFPINQAFAPIIKKSSLTNENRQRHSPIQMSSLSNQMVSPINHVVSPVGSAAL